ncbi:hypothetical protein PUNSTDRAFT_56535 [Punctularia strigosozonata HHB-11173 SS5]|uniref:uncharacterized protein n=1 Tax=Punctularia strigosozonata (strain HHB-11173) TaxID=741275 RepID=UPI00044176A1|nr:uncharacterized protein PUNSTDRAFT_56535 [Punctularia strigosozonata HHB-11173 SS5]EIN13607.1 hypothetical protein PUNSTDRAFT_56535 [Punctularia strigosozonata HHB-11173 SS5]
MTSKAKSKAEEAEQFLNDLDTLSPSPAPSGKATPAPANQGDPADVLAFLDEITQKSSEPTRIAHIDRPLSRAGTPTLRKSGERVKVGASGSIQKVSSVSSTSLPSAAPAAASAPSSSEQQEASFKGGWGWGSVWSSASAAIQQARTVVDEQVKNLPKNEQAKKWSEGAIAYAKTAQDYAKTAQLDKLSQDFKRVGLSTLTDILNVVAPPIAEHEVIQVWLSYDMQGYDGVQSIVYRALARIMEQVEGGDLIVNKGDESHPKDENSAARDMNAAEGLEAAIKLAQANLEELVKRDVKPTVSQHSSAEVPVTYTHIYIRIQPFTTSITVPASPTPADAEPNSQGEQSSQSILQFLIQLVDPGHNLSHVTITQSVPARWLEIWDKYEWVEDMVVETLRQGVEVLGQEYVVARMRWDDETKNEDAPAPAAA